MSRNACNCKNNKYNNHAKKHSTENNNYSENQGRDTGKYNKSLKERRERGFPVVTKRLKITIINALQ